MAGLRGHLTVSEVCAVAYLMLCEQLDKAAEIRYQVHLNALAMGGQGDAPNLAQMQHEARELLDRTLSEDKQLDPEQRVLREALGLKV